MPIRVLIVDDHAAVRRGIRSLVSRRADWYVCGEAADGWEGAELARELRPDVVLMDMSMPRMGGAEATRIIRRDVPDARVIIVTQNDPEVVRQQATGMDAQGYVSKVHLITDLIPAILKVVGQGNGDEKGDHGRPKASDHNAWLFGGGKLGSMIREFDWSRTPLGRIEQWPQSLRTAVNLMLNSQHPMWIGWGPERTFLYNDAYVAVLSLAKHPWALGRPASEVWAEIWDVCGPLADKVFSKGEPSFVDDVRLFMNRGDRFEETYYSFSYSPIYDEAGAVAGLFCPSTEITAKVLHARRLRAISELSAKSLIEKSTRAACESCIKIISQNPDDVPFALLYLINPQRKMATLEGSSQVCAGVHSVSPLTINLDVESPDTLWPVREVAGGTEPRVLTLGDVPSLPRGLAGQRVREAMVLPVTLAGMERPLGVLIAGVNPTRSLDPEYRTFFSLLAAQVAIAIQNVRAVEEVKEQADALAEVDRAKTTFFSNVSHEFRTPLTLMLAPLEDMLADPAAPASKQRERVEMAHRNSLRLLKLVNTLLDFSRIEAGRLRALYEPVDLAKLTAELASTFRSAMERADIRFIIDCPSLGEPVYVDLEMWEKIVFNLLSNAFKFTFSGEIGISLRKIGDSAELTVKDSGTGIPAADLPHLFERFYRVTGARGRTFEGSGIGLALVQELAKQHGGTVRVESELNRGSTFTVRLPLGKDHLPADRIGAERTFESIGIRGKAYADEALHWLPDVQNALQDIELEPASFHSATDTASLLAGGRRAHILLADDNADMRDYLSRLLSDQYEVEAVSDGEAALQRARVRMPDLILSDVMMPRLDGFGLLDALRADDALKSIPVILLSARAGEESRIEGLQSGADDYLVKPFSARELLARVRSQLVMSRIRKEAAAIERKLRLDAELLASIVASSDDAIVSKNLDGVITSWNQGAERIFGYTSQEAVGQRITLIIPRDRWDEEADILARLRRGERIENFQTVRRRKDGELLDVSVTISPIRDSSGRIIGASKVGRDITAQRRAAEALRESEARFRALVNATSHVVYGMNPDWSEMLHLEGRGFLSDTGEPNKNWLQEYIYPEDQRLVLREIQKAVRNKSLFELEHRVWRGDGSVGWTLSRAVPLLDEGGRITEWFGAASDITEHKLAEERERKIMAETAEANAKFRAVFEQTTVFAGIMTKNGIMVDANKLCLEACGYRPEEVLGLVFWDTPWWRNFHESRDKIRAATPLVAQGIPYRETLRYSWADGTERIVDFALYPILDDGGKVLFLHPTGVDITDFKRVEENYRKLAETLEAEVKVRTSELERQNAEMLRQSEQVRALSRSLLQAQDDERRRIALELHDSAGQILVVLGMNLSALVDTAKESDPKIAESAAETLELVQQLTREIRTTSYLLHPPLLDESGLPAALSWYVEGLPERSGLDIQLKISEKFGRLPREMELVVFRLVQECLTNVHRHSGSKSASIKIRREPERILIEVRDQGKGISPERLAEIQMKGSGVGIRGMRERLRQFGGDMVIESDATGTTVSVTIPLPKEERTVEQGREQVA